ncbi:S41 family Peptidase [Thecamonas trahens ATCC 50062]|uniref:S41 family Peptidase n=1 Tax=Thecamonas trahens ATCC 50062 TaxID=461836 RepID=A0A0L0DTN9_THETB|nr:S41 family Peptidase [Thecamonas trahens ATCC 50062]KNC54843.1 S41 family Peptidase [Thecamonas trahens ATCC 50062]|eukprot:XP_013761740.1 S41 family Peptidase [Thecamonas trahens ATCC 50062]
MQSVVGKVGAGGAQRMSVLIPAAVMRDRAVAAGAGALFVRVDGAGAPLTPLVFNTALSPVLEEAAPQAELLVIAPVSDSALYITIGLCLVPGLHWVAPDADVRVAFRSLQFRSFGALKHLLVPPAPLNEIQLLNMTVLAHLYAVLRFFHPSDEAAATPWDELLHSGVVQALHAITPTKLAAALAMLFGPAAPLLAIYVDTPQEAMSLDMRADYAAAADAVRWRHHGLGVRGLGPPSSFFSSARLTRSAALATPPYSALLAQETDATPFAGAPYLFSAFLATRGRVVVHMIVGVVTHAGLYLSLEAMDDEPISGTTPFTEYHIQGRVPADAATLVIGFLLKGIGTLELVAPHFEVPATSASFAVDGRDHFVNLDMADNSLVGWQLQPSAPEADSRIRYSTSSQSRPESKAFVVLTAEELPPAPPPSTSPELSPQAESFHARPATSWRHAFDPADPRSHYIAEDIGRGIGMALPTVVYVNAAGFTLPADAGPPAPDTVASHADALLAKAAYGDGARSSDSSDSDLVGDGFVEDDDGGLRISAVDALYLPTALSLYARLTIVVEMWTALTYFSPAVAAQWPDPMFSSEWRAVLTDTLLDAAVDDSLDAFLDTLRHAVHRVLDGQASVSHVSHARRLYVLPFEWRWIDGLLVVTRIYPGCDLAVGDVIVTLEGVPAAELLQELAVYVSASTREHMVSRVLAQLTLGTKHQPLRVEVDPGPGRPTSPRILVRSLKISRLHRVVASGPLSFPRPGVAVIAAAQLTPQLWTEWMESGTLDSVRVVVVDVRHPAGLDLALIAQAFFSSAARLPAPAMYFPAPAHPRSHALEASQWYIGGAPWMGRLASRGVKLVTLASAGAVGATELWLHLVREHSLGVIVADGASGGAMGPTVSLDLLSGFSLVFTGAAPHGVSQIAPDVLAEATLAHLRSNRGDYLLDSALAVAADIIVEG